MTKLAVLGGSPVRDTKVNPWPKWPVWDKNEEKALIEVLRISPKRWVLNMQFQQRMVR